MKLNVEVMQSSAEMYKYCNSVKLLCNGVEYKNVVEIDTEAGYLDYIAKDNDDRLIIVGQRLLINRIFGKCEIKE